MKIIKIANVDQYGEEIPVDANGFEAEADEFDGGAVGDGIELPEELQEETQEPQEANDPIKTFISQLSEKIGKNLTLTNYNSTPSDDFEVYSFETGSILGNDVLSFMASCDLSIYLTTHAIKGGLILYIFKKKQKET